MFFEDKMDMDVLEVNVETTNSDDEVLQSISDYCDGGHAPYNYHPTPEEEAAAKAEEEVRDLAFQTITVISSHSDNCLSLLRRRRLQNTLPKKQLNFKQKQQQKLRGALNWNAKAYVTVSSCRFS